MRNITRFGLAALLMTAVAGLASAQNRDGANKPSIGPTPHADRSRSRDGQHRQGGEEDHARQPLSPARDQPHPSRRPARRQRLRSPERRTRSRSPGSRSPSAAPSRKSSKGLDHQNGAQAVMAGTPAVNANQLITIGHGFNNAVANLNVNAQIAPGIRVAMTSLSLGAPSPGVMGQGRLSPRSTRRRSTTPLLKGIMKYTTLRVGHFEINYGDCHFRRSDNGNSMYNPFVGNYILDVFTTEIGAEVYARSNGLIAMLGATGGEVHGQVTAPEKRSMSVLGKVGFDESARRGPALPPHRLVLREQQGGEQHAVHRRSRRLGVLRRAREHGVDGDGERVVGPDPPGLLEQGECGSDQPVHQDRRRRVLRQLRDGRRGARSRSRSCGRCTRTCTRGCIGSAATTSSTLAARYNTLKGQLISKNYDGRDGESVSAGRWLVRDAERAGEAGVGEPEVHWTSRLTDIRSGGQFKGFMISGAVGF